jgi:hypothetical protein
VLFQIIYNKESSIIVTRTVASLFWLFVIPGAVLLRPWREKIGTAAWLVMGTVLGMATAGIGSYYLGLLGINLKYSAALLPALVIASGVVLQRSKRHSNTLSHS